MLSLTKLELLETELQLFNKSSAKCKSKQSTAYVALASVPSQFYYPTQGSVYNQQAVHGNFPDTTWYLYSGASNHITPDINTLSLHSPYTGTTKVAVACR